MHLLDPAASAAPTGRPKAGEQRRLLAAITRQPELEALQDCLLTCGVGGIAGLGGLDGQHRGAGDEARPQPQRSGQSPAGSAGCK